MEGFNGSRTIAPPPPNCPRGNLPPLPPTPKLTLTQTLTLTRGQFSTMAIVWLPPTLKLTLTLTQTPIPNRGAIVRIPGLTQAGQKSLTIGILIFKVCLEMSWSKAFTIVKKNLAHFVPFQSSFFQSTIFSNIILLLLGNSTEKKSRKIQICIYTYLLRLS